MMKVFFGTVLVLLPIFLGAQGMPVFDAAAAADRKKIKDGLDKFFQDTNLTQIVALVENSVQTAGTMKDMYNNAKAMLAQIEQNVKTADATFRSMEDQLKGMKGIKLAA